ncbi:hypothetical protein [Flavihumibacter profundi]|uniref:hypothetical protein n=1 Tax=Flavihumibacter profundi TaxID=2716883 RepID=UPI001CC48938|nr:hypothetical protein [Flavihumibacter profundi]MBZ5858287.1 hypothetical protein [Flavihumibacter profundi]
MVTRFIPLLLFVVLQGNPIRAQQLDAHDFGTDYTSAKEWLHSSEAHWKKLEQDGYDKRLAMAVIFPELLRYSRLRDKIELFALQVLYIQFGKDYADFSIGPFQMKPSFAEQLDVNFSQQQPVEPETIANRKERVDLLNSAEGQFTYLRRFLQWMDKTYAKKHWNTAGEKIKFYASAYNCGFNKPESYITGMLRQKNFRLSETSLETYNYSAIAAWFYYEDANTVNTQFIYLYGNNPSKP